MKAKALSIVTVIALLLSLIPAAVLPLAAGAAEPLSAVPTGPGGGPSAQEVITWVKYTGNPVLNPGAAGTWDELGVASPAVLLVGGTYHLWYAGQNAAGIYQIGHATSPDGLVWAKDAANPVLPPGAAGAWDAPSVAEPSVVKIGANYHMWYTGGNYPWIAGLKIGHATSPDGVVWAKDAANPVLPPGAAGAWDESGLFGHAVLLVGGTYHLWYTGMNAANTLRMGHATSPDGVAWAKDAANPVLTPGPAGSWDAVRVQDPSVLLEGGTYHMRYVGANAAGTFQIGHATSAVPDGAGWAKDAANPVLVPGPAAWDANHVWDADVILGSQKMWYSGTGASGKWQIGYAVLATKGITISPNSGPVGTNVVVNGFGYTPGEFATVTFGSPALVVAGVPVGPDGKFNVAFNVPDSTKGSHVVDAYTPVDPAADTPDQLFVVTPSLLLSQPGGGFGDVITATWKGFLANEAGLKVMFDGVDQPTTPAAPVANASGTGSATWTVPAAARGPHVVDGRGATTTAAEVPNVPFLVRPMLLAPNPAAGTVGTLVNIGVRGFNPGEGGIFITMNPGPVVVLGPGVANAQGSYDGAFNVPPKTKGVHILDAYGSATNALDIVDRSFTVNSSLALAPNAGPKGTLVAANMEGFAPNSPITMTFAGGNPGNVIVTVLAVDTDADGSAAGSFTVPDAANGAHTVTATDGAGNSANAAFTVGAGVFIVPTAGPVGQVVDVSGAGFAPNEDNIKVTEDGVDMPLTNQSIPGTVAGTAKADVFGAWTAKFTVASVAGPHIIDAYGAITPALAVQEAIFTVQPNLILTPTSGYGGTTVVTAEGHGFGPNKTVTFTFGGVAQATNAAVTTNATGDFTGATFTAPIRSAGVHQVVATDASANSGAAPFNILGGPVQNLRTGTYYGTIGAAINAAATLPGDTLVAFPGLYKEYVNLNHANLTLKSYDGAPIILEGEALTAGNTTIDGTGIAGGQALLIAASGVTVKGFTIRDADAGSLAVRVGGSSATVDDCILRDSPAGGLVKNDVVNNLTVKNSILTANAGVGGIWLNTGSGDVIQNNQIGPNTGRGLRVASTNVSVSNNTISQNTTQGIFTDGTGGIYSGNTISQNGLWGVQIGPTASNTTLNDNTISLNVSHGIYTEALNTTITQNIISGNTGYGVVLFAPATSSASVRWNNFSGNTFGALRRDGDTIRLRVTTALNGAAAVNDTVTVNYIKGDGTAASVDVTITDAQVVGVVAVALPAGVKVADVTDVSLAKGAGATSTAGVFNIEGDTSPNRVLYTYNLAGPVKTDGVNLTVDALFNWWGHASGPTIPSNVGGTGQAIGGTGRVLYSPWLGAAWPAAGPLDAPAVATPTVFHVNASNPGSIQAAINAASPGDTILAHPGTYNEKANVNKTLTLASTGGAATTILNGAGLPGSIITVTADDVVIGGLGFTIQNAAENAILFTTSPMPINGGLVQDNILQNNVVGVAISEEASGIMVRRNQIVNNSYGMWIAGDNNIIRGNIIKSNGASGGVRLIASAEGNHINWNHFWGNVMGVSRAGTPVDARYNYWNHPLGPTHASNPGGVGDPITDNVLYSPWLGLVPGTVPMTFYVNPTGTIQEAIDTAQPGDTVLVRPGTYNESLVIAPPLTVASTDGALATIIDAQTAPVGVYIHDPGVIFRGFTVKNCYTGIVAELSDGVQILDNIVLIGELVPPPGPVQANGWVDMGEGIVVGGSAHALVRGNRVEVETTDSALGIVITTALPPQPEGQPAAQPAYVPSPQAHVVDNSVAVTSHQVDGQAKPSLWEQFFGIAVDHAPSSLIDNNLVTVNVEGWYWAIALGILVEYSPLTQVGGAGNDVNVSNIGELPDAYGIYLAGSPEAGILQNHLTVNSVGQSPDYPWPYAFGIVARECPKVIVGGNTATVLGQADLLVPAPAAATEPQRSPYTQALKLKELRAKQVAAGKGPRGQGWAEVGVWGAIVQDAPGARVLNNQIGAIAKVGVALVPAPVGAQQWADAYAEGLVMVYSPLSEVGGNNIGASAEVVPGSEQYLWPYTWALGVDVYGCEKINIHNNDVWVNSVYDGYGMSIWDSPRSDVVNNNVNVTLGPNDWWAYGDGVDIYYSDYLLFKGNTVNVNGSVAGPWPGSYVYLWGVLAVKSDYVQILSNNIAVNGQAHEPFGYSWVEGIHLGNGQWGEVAANNVNVLANTILVPWDYEQYPYSAARPRPARSDEAKAALEALAKSKGLKKQDGYQYGEAFSRAIHVVSAPHAEVVRNTAHATSQIGPAGPGTLGTDDYQYGEGYAEAYGIEVDYSPHAIVQSNQVNANAQNHLVVEAEGSLAPPPSPTPGGQQGAEAWGWGWSEAVGVFVYSSQDVQVNQNSVVALGNMTLDIMAIGYGGAFNMSEGALMKFLSRFKESMQKSQEAALERSGQKASQPAAQWAYSGFRAVAMGIGIWAVDSYGIQIVGNNPVQGSGLLTGNAYAADLIFDHEAGAYGWGLALGEGIEVDWSDHALIKGNNIAGLDPERPGAGALAQTNLVIVAEELPAVPAAQWAEAMGMGEALAYGILAYESYSPDIVNNRVSANADSNVGVLASEGFRWEEAWASSYAGAQAIGIGVFDSPGNLVKGNNASASASAHQDDRAEGVGVDPWAEAYAESYGMGILVFSYGYYGSQQQGQDGNPYFDTRIIENTATGSATASGVATAVETPTLPLHAGAYTEGYSYGAGILVESWGYYSEGSAQQYYYGALIQGNQAQGHANTTVDAHSTDTTAVPEAYAYGYGGSHADGIALMGAGNSLVVKNTVGPVSANTTVNVSAAGEITNVGKWGYAYADGIDLYSLWNVQVVANSVSGVGSWLNVDPNGEVVYNGPGYSTDIYGFYLGNPLIKGNTLDYLVYGNPGHGVDLFFTWKAQVLENNLWPNGYVGGQKGAAIRGVYSWGMRIGGNTINGWGNAPSTGIALLQSWGEVFKNNIHNNGVGIFYSPQSGYYPDAALLAQLKAKGIEPPAAGTVPMIEAHMNNINGNAVGVLAKAPSPSPTSDAGAQVGVVGPILVNAALNWWGHISGPSGEGTGSGDKVSKNVEYRPWLTIKFETQLAEDGGYFGMERWFKLKGWNTLATPIRLREDANNLGSIVNAADYDLAYRFNNATQAWELIDSTFILNPLEAIFTHSVRETRARFLFKHDPSEAPERALVPGWALLSLAPSWDPNPPFYRGDWRRPVEDALRSINGKYSRVLNPRLDMERGWTVYVEGGTSSWSPPGPPLATFEGYWVEIRAGAHNVIYKGSSLTPVRMPGGPPPGP